MTSAKYDYGMIGLGTMGRNLVFNINDHGYSVVGFDKDAKQVEMLAKEGVDRSILSTTDLKNFMNSLKRPRNIILLVPAGTIVDSVIADLVPFWSKDDLIMDCGNSHFTDTDRRCALLAGEQIHFMGVGVSGGESGARYGPSIMPGGPVEVYDRVSEMLKSIAAKVNGEPCVACLGNGSAGHYVKMVHNGIEYAIMQLISESYQLLKVFGGMTNDELNGVFAKWNKGRLQSFLIEITAEIFLHKDELSPNSLVDMILDTAHQKGTGAWTSKEAMNLQVPIPTIDVAVTMRNLSAMKNERLRAESLYGVAQRVDSIKKEELINNLEQGLFFSMLISYAQGMTLLSHASENYGYGVKLAEVAGIWRGGCIIRAACLENVRAAYAAQPELASILLNETIADELTKSQGGLRETITAAVQNGIPVPAMMSALGYFDSYRSGRLPANLLQAQRDYFGAHTYERTDKEGKFHTEWMSKK